MHGKRTVTQQLHFQYFKMKFASIINRMFKLSHHNILFYSSDLAILLDSIEHSIYFTKTHTAQHNNILIINLCSIFLEKVLKCCTD